MKNSGKIKLQLYCRKPPEITRTGISLQVALTGNIFFIISEDMVSISFSLILA